MLVGQLVLSEDLFPRQIADRLGTTAEHIHHLHDAYPIDWLTRRTRPPSRSQTDQWRTWYVEQERTLREIASAARVTRRDVTQALRNAGVDIRSGGGRRRYDEETYADVVEQHSTIRISQDLGIPVTGIVRMLRRQGIASRTRSARPLKHAERLTEVVHRYTVDKQGTTAIAKATGIPSSTVTSMLERAGVTRRPRSQRRGPTCS